MAASRFSIPSFRAFVPLAAIACVAFFTRSARADGDEPEKKNAADPSEFELAGDGVVVRVGDHEQTLKVGCVARSFAASGSRAYVLCGMATVVTIEAKGGPNDLPHIVVRARYDARFISLTMIQGVISARTATGVKPLDEYLLAPANARDEVIRPPRHARFDEPSTYVRPPPPPPITGFEIDATATGGIGVDTFPGASVTLDAAFVYRFDVPFSIAAYGVVGAATGSFDNGQATFGPSGGDVQIATGEALVSLDLPVFAIGIGGGVGMLDDGYEVEPLFVTRGRIGRVDAFEARWHMAFATSGRTVLGELGGSLEFRLDAKWWLGVEAEFGNLRYGRAMLDVRRRLVAPKDHKGATVDLRAGLGLAVVHTSSDCALNDEFGQSPPAGSIDECIGTNADYLGPAVSLGLVFRP
jgi:hypothetical protein